VVIGGGSLGQGFKDAEKLLVELRFDVEHGILVGALLFHVIGVQDDMGGEVAKIFGSGVHR
jgi:hypothetical protein